VGELLSVLSAACSFRTDCGFRIWIKGSLVHGRIDRIDGGVKGYCICICHFLYFEGDI